MHTKLNIIMIRRICIRLCVVPVAVCYVVLSAFRNGQPTCSAWTGCWLACLRLSTFMLYMRTNMPFTQHLSILQRGLQELRMCRSPMIMIQGPSWNQLLVNGGECGESYKDINFLGGFIPPCSRTSLHIDFLGSTDSLRLSDSFAKLCASTWTGCGLNSEVEGPVVSLRFSLLSGCDLSVWEVGPRSFSSH